MQSKTKILISGSVATLLLLTAIQSYLIYNTYKLKQKMVYIDAKNTIAKLYNSPQADSLFWFYKDDLVENLKKYKQQKISKIEVLDRLHKKAASTNPYFMRAYKKVLKENGSTVEVKFKMMISGLLIYDDTIGKKDIFIDQNNSPLHLVGEDFKDKGADQIINSGILDTEISYQLNGKEKMTYMKLKTVMYMDVDNWYASVFRQMLGILVLSVLLFIFVVALLQHSIANLIKQKRNAEIRTDFINNMTHELKTPLSTLSIASNTLSNEYFSQDKEVAREALHTINRQNIRLQNLIEQVVNKSLGYDEIELNKEHIATYPFFENLINDFKLTLDDEVSLDYKIEITGTDLYADEFCFSTAILNILSNAVKYNGTKIFLHYSFNTEEGNHIVTVTDNGIGISKRYQRLIFEKFFRVSEKDKHDFKGLGLGLYYCNQIIKAHGGSVSIKSKEGNGSTFCLTIPKQQP